MTPGYAFLAGLILGGCFGIIAMGVIVSGRDE